TKEQMRTFLDFQGLLVNMSEDEIENVHIRLSSWLLAMDEVEAAIGPQMDEVDPIPPVYPTPEF
ncbi:MAG: hypothetical protein RIC93_09740, partial [Alphaproteobacteria bacterium]